MSIVFCFVFYIPFFPRAPPGCEAVRKCQDVPKSHPKLCYWPHWLLLASLSDNMFTSLGFIRLLPPPPPNDWILIETLICILCQPARRPVESIHYIVCVCVCLFVCINLLCSLQNAKNLTCDTSHAVGGEHSLKMLALTVLLWICLKDISTKYDPATPGLLIIRQLLLLCVFNSI